MNSMHPPSKCPNGREAFDLFPYDVDTSLVWCIELEAPSDGKCDVRAEQMSAGFLIERSHF